VPKLLLSHLPKFIEFYLCIQMLPLSSLLLGHLVHRNKRCARYIITKFAVNNSVKKQDCMSNFNQMGSEFGRCTGYNVKVSSYYQWCHYGGYNRPPKTLFRSHLRGSFTQCTEVEPNDTRPTNTATLKRYNLSDKKW